jgi:4-amino-4-deoxy-L-arabinose transferase-like glycosyltransferase
MTLVSPAGRRGIPKFWLWVFVLGLLIRLVLLSTTTTLRIPIVDEQHFNRIAIQLSRGGGFGWNSGELTSRRPPLYPALLAGVWKTVGERSFQTVRVLQILMAGLTAILVYQLGRRAFNESIAIRAAALFWMYPTLLYFNFTILSETLFTFLLIAFVWFTVKLAQEPRAWTAVLCGMALGLAALTRSVLWPLPLVFCPLLVAIIPGRVASRIALAALVLVGYAIPVVPWAVRNTRLQGVVTIVDTMGGRNLRMGNYEHTPEDHMWDAVAIRGEENWAVQLAQERPGETLTEGQTDKWAQQKAVEYILANPLTTARRGLIKLADFWGIEREYAGAVQKHYYRSPRFFELSAATLIVVAFIGTAVLGTAGIWLARPHWRVHIALLVPILALMGAHSLAFGHSRYHVPLMPIMGLYACALLSEPGIAGRRADRAALAGAGLSTAALVAIWIRQVSMDFSRITALLNSLV